MTLLDDSSTMSGTPAAWYPCPQFDGLLRWWDGSAWTVHTLLPPPSVAADALAAQAAAAQARVAQFPIVQERVEQARVAEARVEDRFAAYDFNSMPYEPMKDTAPRYGDGTRRSAMLTPDRGSVTPWAWFVAVVPPLLTAGLVLIAFELADQSAVWQLYIWVLVTVLVSLVLASGDGYELRRRGHPAPGWGWGLLPPVYLIVRAVMFGSSSVWVLFGWVVVQVASIGAVLVLDPLL
ncbi:hypothetical protein HD599_001367 [Conyzicola lurida]|uniref:DUF2510 domain-containing protein n=1 Tax=Conyzicola lurida TaxID=1172621 RepID=A0A841AKX3_9MICO|nr:DUF2510 domain-containing protein [Conyzicola lurida]MBB5843044.1 hypothetical protein [Conyzicola lurida]